jgi:hypothetical protein
MPTFFVPKGTPGLLRTVGGKWRSYRTTKSQTFATALRHKGRYLIFTSGAYEFMALADHVGCGCPLSEGANRDPRERYGAINRCILGPNGRGASQRRAVRRRRR